MKPHLLKWEEISITLLKDVVFFFCLGCNLPTLILFEQLGSIS